MIKKSIAFLLCIIAFSPLFGMPQPVFAELPQASQDGQQCRRAPAYYGTTITRNILLGITFLSLPSLAAGQSNATTMDFNTYMHNFYIVSGVSVGLCALSSCAGCIYKNIDYFKRQRDTDEDNNAQPEQIA